MAEHLYIELLTSADGLNGPSAQSSAALRVLAGCCWDGDIGTAKTARQQLFPLLRVTPPTTNVSKRPQQKGAAVRVGHDVQGSSYQQLVDRAALH